MGAKLGSPQLECADPDIEGGDVEIDGGQRRLIWQNWESIASPELDVSCVIESTTFEDKDWDDDAEVLFLSTTSRFVLEDNENDPVPVAEGALDVDSW